MNHEFNRRYVLAAALSLLIPGCARKPAPKTAGPGGNLDFTDPEDNLHALVKLRGDLSGQPALIGYQGTGFAVMPDRMPAPLYRVQGLVRSTWTLDSNGNFNFETYDLGFYGDLQTGAPLESFENPYNGAKVEPIHVHDGPLRSSYSIHGSTPSGRPADETKELLLPWQRSGDEIWFEQSLGFEFPNPLKPSQWPNASSGETIRFRFHNTFRGRLSDLEDPALTSAPLTAIYMGIGPWPPWLVMGQTPGHQVLQYQARKLEALNEIPPMMQDYMERIEPTYLTADAPWTESANSWERYKQERG